MNGEQYVQYEHILQVNLQLCESSDYWASDSGSAELNLTNGLLHSKYSVDEGSHALFLFGVAHESV